MFLMFLIESSHLASHDRWLMLVADHAEDDGYRYYLVGLDIKEEEITIGLYLPITMNTRVALDGDGAIVVTGDVQKPTTLAAFKPISIQGNHYYCDLLFFSY